MRFFITQSRYIYLYVGISAGRRLDSPVQVALRADALGKVVKHREWWVLGPHG